MKLHRFAGNFHLKKGVMKIKDEVIVHQARDVLKLHSGERIILCDGRKNDSTATILSTGREELEVNIEDIYPNINEPAVRVGLFCAVLKSDNFELVAQKTIESGVSEIFPVLTERTVKEGVRYDRVRRIMKEASEQAGRGIIPSLSGAVNLTEALIAGKKDFDAQIFFDGQGGAFEDLRIKQPKSIAIFIGPEGGWSSRELTLAKDAGYLITSLGALTLRAETAAIIGTYLASRL